MNPRLLQVVGTAAVGALIVLNLPAEPSSSSAAAELESLGVPDFAIGELDDGASHFLVRTRTGSEEALEPPPENDQTRRLVLDEDGRAAVVAVGVTDADAQATAPTDLFDHDQVSEVTLIGSDLYAVTTTLGVDEMAALAGVADVAPDVPMGTLALAAEDDATGPYEVHQWALENTGQKFAGPAGVPDADIDGPHAWPHATGHGVVVAVIDTGVDADHPDIAPNLWVNPDEDCTNGIDDDDNGFVDDCNGWDFVHDDPSIDDTDTTARHDHGTHVSGVIAAPRDATGVTGVAPGADLMVLKVIEHQAFWMSDAIRAIDYAVANGARVINISWGTTPSTAQADVEALETALIRAEDAGVVVVAAAGNEAVDLDATPIQPASLPNPGLITVGATTNTDQKASFSAFGGATVDLFAPGEHVVGPTTDDWAFMGGSSVAAAHVSGAAALVLERWPEMSPAAVRQLLVDTADLIPALDGLAKQPARLNVGNLFASDGSQARLLFTGFDAVKPDTPAATAVEIARDRAADPLSVRATLLVRIDGEVHAVIGHPVLVDEGQTTTDTSGQFALGVAGADVPSVSLGLTITLPAGEFGLVVELIDDRTGLAVQPAEAVFFAVGAPATTPPQHADPEPGAGDGEQPETAGADPDDERVDAGLPSPGSALPGPNEPEDAVGSVDADESVETEPFEEGSAEEPAADGPPETTGDPAAPADRPADEPSDDGPSTDAGTDDEIADDGPAPATPATGPEPPGQAEPEGTVAPADSPPPATVTSLAPTSGPSGGGTIVVIQGSGFDETSIVSFGGEPATLPASITESQIVVKTRAHDPGTVDVSVTSSAGESATLPEAFTFVAATDGAGPVEDAESAETTDPPHTNQRPDTPDPGATQPSGQQPLAPGDKPVETGPFSDVGDDPPDAAGHEPLELRLGPPVAQNGLTIAPVIGPAAVLDALSAAWESGGCAGSSCAGVELA